MTKPIPLTMGILNVTPDSFSDGGQFTSVESALKHAEKLVQEGADIIDVGGESTRPGAKTLSWEEEAKRVIPVLDAIRGRLPVRLSIDTRKYEVAIRALDCGVTLINDVSGGSDPRFLSLLERTDVEIILMHMQGSPETMQDKPSYPLGVVTEVKKFLESRVKRFEEAGIERERIWVDPGIGFGKTVNQNLDLLRHLKEFKGIAGKVVIGTSRKSFLGKFTSDASDINLRDSGTIASNLWAWEQGAEVFRVHEVEKWKAALRTHLAIQEGII